MHELSIAQSVIEIVEDNIKNMPEPRVKSVTMKIGKMSNILAESLVFGFDSLITGTGLEGAKLVIDEIPVVLKCRGCSTESVLEGFNFFCSACGSTDVEMISGKELTVSEIELE